MDLRACRLRWADGRADFVVDDRARRMLLEGKDAIEQTLLRQDAIAAYEARRAPWMPAVPRGAFDAASATVAP
ncbi:3-isopropylmalate dehydratase small subunit OS=Streptomyces rimosus subsp. rimosus (strain ATCC/ DSM 40260 / JCM 4667 / NRRL 2234) OX=1265868 GN=leuD PE=3 SV=1 [Streptomyces rimosus subsp. rimosus]